MSASSIKKLAALADHSSRLILGLMSGTSLDGLDLALCRISGSGKETWVEVLQFETAIYQPFFKSRVLEVFALPGAPLAHVCSLNSEIADTHAQLVNETLKKWGLPASQIDCIASHGQTIFHYPKRFNQMVNFLPSFDSTLQLGDGDHLAVKTGILTVSDFRQKHIAAGGEGAPLALYGDHLLFSSAGENRALLNIGGIANFTWLPAGDNSSSVFSTDTGPGNTLLDACARRYFYTDMDRDGMFAAAGTVNEALLSELLAHPFFREALPKTTGPEQFNLEYVEAARQQSGTGTISPNNLMATLVELTARTISDELKKIATGDFNLYTSGGGSHHPLLIERLQRHLPEIRIQGFDVLGISADAKEAVLFAVLANEMLAGEAVQLGDQPSVCMGKISFPD